MMDVEDKSCMEKKPLSLCHSPVIVIKKGAPFESVEKDVYSSNICMFENAFHVLCLPGNKCKKLINSNEELNKALVIANASKNFFDKKKYLNDGYWKIINIDSESFLLSIYSNSGQIHSRENIFKVFEELIANTIDDDIKAEIPTLDLFVKEIQMSCGQEYLAKVEKDLFGIIDCISNSSKINKDVVDNIIGILSFSGKIDVIKERICNYLNIAIVDVLKQNDDLFVEVICRKIDFALNILFELSVKDSLGLIRDVYILCVDFLIKENADIPILARGLRKSFSKGIDLFNSIPSISVLLKNTKTDDAKGFLLLRNIFLQRKKHQDVLCHKDLIAYLLKISPKNLVSIARDLRRIVPECSIVTEISKKELLESISLYKIKKTNRDVVLGSLLLLYYSGYLPASIISWIIRNYKSIGLTDADVLALSAISGYDVPFIIQTNKNLFSDGYKYKILLPSKYHAIEDYMEACICEWGVNKLSGNNIKHSCEPLVSVIITTFNPNLKLFLLSLKSILCQTYQNIEVIVIDDHSPVESSTAIELLVSKLSSKSAISISYQRNESNNGQYLSRNKAISMAKGEYIAIQDDDDISHPERLQFQIKPMILDSTIMATHSCHLRISEVSRLMLDGDRLGEIMGDAPVSFVWRSKVFQEIGNFLPTKTRGDIEYRSRMSRFYLKGAILSLPQPLVLMRGAMSTVSSDYEYYYKSALNAFRFMMKHIPTRCEKAKDLQVWVPDFLKQ